MLHSLRRRVGFTLVELLVVIGIIALLISILLPALSKVQESSRTLACLSNMRQLGQAAHTYSVDYRGICLPAAWRNPDPISGGKHTWVDDEPWPNILVNARLLQAPDFRRGGISQQMRSVFYCPSGLLEVTTIFSDLDAASPSSRTDPMGSAARRCVSKSTGFELLCWYGINGSTSTSLLGSAPCLRVPLDGKPKNDFSALTKMSRVRRSSQVVMFYDGVYMNLFSVNANRINARHGNKKLTNLAFFDGHAETFQTASLPGGLKAATSDFSLATLNSKYGNPAPKWRLDQN